MSFESVKTFLILLERKQILSTAQVEEVRRELAPDFEDADILGEYLVQVGWLTSYQMQCIINEQWDQLMMGPYQILDRLGEGGVSEVFKAWDTQQGRLVALKMLRQHLAERSEMIRQFHRELQAVKSLSHPNIIRTLEANQVGAVHYFAMEYVQGCDLHRHVMQMGPLSIEDTCEYGRQVAQGLQHAHQEGLVHRDIKPANLFLVQPSNGANGRRSVTAATTAVKILDWGLARCMREPSQVHRRGETNSVPFQIDPRDLEAEKGALIGTADYIAPEQSRDPTLVDTRADIYSLGCTLYFFLTGKTPFPGPSLMQKLMQHREAPRPSVRDLRSDVPEELDSVIQRMMAVEPEQRCQIPLLAVALLRKFCNGSSSPAQPGSDPYLRRPGSSINIPRPPSSLTLAQPVGNRPSGQFRRLSNDT